MQALMLIVLLSVSVLHANIVLAQDSIEVRFENTIETCLPAETLWQQLTKSMSNSDHSWIWPTRLSNVVGEGMQEGAHIDVTYKSIFSDVTYSYELSDIIPGLEFTYTAIPGRHPFVGGARVWIESAEDDTRLFHWAGLYVTPQSASLQRRFFRSYSRDFFRSIKANIATQEPRTCKN